MTPRRCVPIAGNTMQHEFVGVPPPRDSLRCQCGEFKLVHSGWEDDGTVVLIWRPVKEED